MTVPKKPIEHPWADLKRDGIQITFGPNNGARIPIGVAPQRKLTRCAYCDTRTISLLRCDNCGAPL